MLSDEILGDGVVVFSPIKMIMSHNTIWTTALRSLEQLLSTHEFGDSQTCFCANRQLKKIMA